MSMVNHKNITPQKIRQSVMENYDSVVEPYSNDFGTELQDPEVIDAFVSYLKPHANILDIGGGTGKLTDFLIKKGFRAICYDFSKSMMKKAFELFPGIPYVLGDIIHLPQYFKDKTFDGIIAFYSLFYIPKKEIKDVFMHINHLLADNGLLCFVIQLGDGEEWTNEPYLGPDNNALFVNFMTKEQIYKLLQTYHFQIIYEAEKTEVAPTDHQSPKFFVIARKIK